METPARQPISGYHRNLRRLILLEIGLFFLALLSGLFLEHKLLPPALVEWLDQQFDRQTEERSWTFLLATAFGFLILAIVSWIGLWNLWLPALYLYPLLWMLGWIVQLLDGPLVIDAFSSVLADASTLTGGAILTLVFLTPLRQEFLPPESPSP